MRDIIVIVVTAVLSDNIVLSQALGVCPMLGTGDKPARALRMGALTAVCMVAASALSWPVTTLVLIPMGLEYTRTLVFVLAASSAVQLAETVMRHSFEKSAASLGAYLPLTAANCAILEVCSQSASAQFSFAQCVASAAAGGAGFTLALLLFAGIKEKIASADIPESFRGIAIDLIAAAILSLSFMGFSGIAAGIFGS